MLYIPDRDIKTGAVVDIGTFNANLLSLIGVTLGNLGPHNFKSKGIDISKWSKDIAVQCKTKKVASDPQDVATRIGITKTDTWTDIPSVSVELDCRGGMVLIVVSIQCHALTYLGMMLGVKMDGAVIKEQILGSGDLSNDWQAIDIMSFYGAESPIMEAPGFHGQYSTVGLYVMLPSVPGKHVFTPCIYVPRYYDAVCAYSQRECSVIEFMR